MKEQNEENLEVCGIQKKAQDIKSQQRNKKEGEGLTELFPANITEIGLHLIVTNADNTKCLC